MKLKNIDLLTLLISLFALSSCNNPDGIGLDIEPDILLNSSIVDSSTVFTKLIKEDSVASNYTERSVLAYMKDDEFGETTSNIVFALTLPSSNVSFGTNPILDSAVLVMSYSSSSPLYGDSLKYKVNVNQLNETLYSATKQKVFYTNKEWNVNAAIVGSKEFFPAYNDSLNINLYGHQDSIVKIAPQLRIPLNNQFVVDNILSLDSATLSTSQLFANHFKGLRLSIDKISAPANGGAISLDTYTEGASRLEIYYRYTNSEDKQDTTSISFPIAGSSGTAATEVKWENTGTPARTTLDNPAKNHEKLYLKGLAGTKIKVEFPYLDSLKRLGKNLAINRAELIFTAEEPQQTSLTPLSALRIYSWDLAHQPALIPDENPSDARYLGTGYVGGVYNSTKKIYVINVTGYIQDLFRKKHPNYGTYITTYDFYGRTGRLNAPGRSVLLGGASSSPDKVKLKIYYSDLK